ncbi:hypothetical protein ACFQPC_17495 [Herminiimonas glaciei]|uniref:Uncharacterized protein n=1 Tax=Herminiimonas glaciei TaxID=523788 RepID=A0ABW2IFR3_9BURK
MRVELQKVRSLLKMLEMRHIYVLLLLVSLPLQWVWANSVACRTEAQSSSAYSSTSTKPQMGTALHKISSEQAQALGHDQQSPPLPQSIFIEEPTVESEMARWEFEVEGEFGSAAQMLAPDWGDTADNLSCRPPGHNFNSAAQTADPYEADLPLPLSLACLTLGDTIFVAQQHPPLPVPIVRTERPPIQAI